MGHGRPGCETDDQNVLGPLGNSLHKPRKSRGGGQLSVRRSPSSRVSQCVPGLEYGSRNSDAHLSKVVFHVAPRMVGTGWVRQTELSARETMSQLTTPQFRVRRAIRPAPRRDGAPPGRLPCQASIRPASGMAMGTGADECALVVAFVIATARRIAADNGALLQRHRAAALVVDPRAVVRRVPGHAAAVLQRQ